MPTSVNNCIIQCQKGHTPNEKRANFLVFDKSEGAPCPVPPMFGGQCLKYYNFILETRNGTLREELYCR